MFLDLRSGRETRFVAVPDVRRVALGSNGEIVTLSWTAAPQPSAGPGGPTAAPLTATLRRLDAAGAEVFRGKTDERGTFRWRPTSPADYTVTVDAGDEHWVDGNITADRLGAMTGAPAVVVMV